MNCGSQKKMPPNGSPIKETSQKQIFNGNRNSKNTIKKTKKRLSPIQEDEKEICSSIAL